MNPASILRMPWVISHAFIRWLALFYIVTCGAASVAFSHFSHKSDWWLGAVLLYGSSLVFTWVFWLSNSLLLAIDARQLRLPGIQRTLMLSLWFYGLLGVALPTLLVALAGGNALVVGELLALCTTIGLAVALLPRYLILLIGFLPALTDELEHIVDIPSLSDPRFVPYAAAAVGLMLLTIGWRWYRLLHAKQPYMQGLRSALVMYARNPSRDGWSSWSSWTGFTVGDQDSSTLIQQSPDWMQPRADLRNVGPRAPINALRVALGRWYMPQTSRGYLIQILTVLVSMLFFIATMATMQSNASPRNFAFAILHGAGIDFIGWLGAMGGTLLMATTVMALTQRWSKVNAELPLLALLPGLGNGMTLRRMLLRAGLGMPLAWMLPLLLLMLFAAWQMQLNVLGFAFITIAQLGNMATMVALVLSIFGGRMPRAWATVLLICGVFILGSLSTFMPSATMGAHSWQFGGYLLLAIGAGWLAIAGVLLWLGLRGWRGLRERPHPFLPV